jgi:hypothetical protein
VELQVAEARWFAPDLLVIELVLPFAGSAVPGGVIEFNHELEDGRVVKLQVQVVPELSTEPGFGNEGRIVKLALKLGPEAAAIGSGVFAGEWRYIVQGSDGDAVEVPVRFRLKVPGREATDAPSLEAGPDR